MSLRLMALLSLQHLALNGDPGAGGGGGNPNPGAGGGGGNPNPGAGGPPAGGAPANDWRTGLSEELRGFVELKGFKDPGSIVDSYRGLERMMGVPKDRLLTIPEKADDVEGWKQIHAKLGRPEKPEDYNFTLKPEQGDEKFVGQVKNWFHELGLNKNQAETFMKKYGEYFDTEVQAVTQSMTAQLAQQQDTLKREWGAAFEQNQKVAQKAVAAFQLTGEAIDALESVMGYDGVHKFLHAVGSKLGEDNFVSGQGGTPGFNGAVLSPAAAKAAIEEKKRDQGWFNRYLSGDKEAVAEWNRLNAWAAAQ